MNKKIIISSTDHLKPLKKLLFEALENGAHSVEIKKVVAARSPSQRKALELYCKFMAKKLNAAGYDQNAMVDKMKSGFKIPISPSWVKDIIRQVGFDEFGKESTAELSTTEMSKTHMYVDAGFSRLVGVQQDWPDKHGGGK